MLDGSQEGAPSTAQVVRPWPLVASERGPDLMVCRVRFDTLVNPRNGQSFPRVVLEAPAWVNVVALTPERKLVAVRQYRFGARAITLEIPGGIVDPGEQHAAAARRELREETGYVSERWSYLGAVEANPAIQDNLCHHWLAEDARREHELELDQGEDIQVLELDERSLSAALCDGSMRHSLVHTALARVFDLRCLLSAEARG